MDDLAVKLAVPFAFGPIQVDRQLVLLEHLLHALEVVDCLLGAREIAIAGRERVPELPEGREPVLFAVALDHRVPKQIAPGARRDGDLLLDVAHVVGRNLARRRTDDEMPARERRVGHVLVVRRHFAVERALENRLDPVAHFRREPVARQVDQRRDEPVEHILPDEGRNALTLLQLQDPHRDVVELFFADLVDLVTGKGFQDLNQLFPGMARPRQSRVLDDAVDLAPEQRDLADASRVRRRSEQPEEPVLADQIAGGVVALDPDPVHVRRAVNRRAVVRFGHDDQLFAPGKPAELRRERHLTTRAGLRPDFAQQTEACPRHDLQKFVRLVRYELVLAIAEKNEMLVGQPAEKLLRLLHFVAGDRRVAVVDLLERLEQPRPHRQPVGHREPDVRKNRFDVLLQLVEIGRLSLLVDLEMHVRLVNRGALPAALVSPEEGFAVPFRIAADGEDRVDDQVDVPIDDIHLTDDRVDQERHVVVHDLHHRVARAPTVLGDRRIEQADLRLFGLSLRSELPEGERSTEKGLRVDVQIVGRDQGEVFAHEARDALSLIRIFPLGLLGQAVDELSLAGLLGDGHEKHSSLAGRFSAAEHVKGEVRRVFCMLRARARAAGSPASGSIG